MSDVFLTRQGYEKLRLDLQALRDRRQALAKDIQEAAEKGDLKENAEYHAAKEEQAKVQRRVGELEVKLRSAQLIEESSVVVGEIRIGATARLEDLSDKSEVVYTFVDSAEADFSQGRISVRSPLAQGLLGHKEGEEVKIQLPGGVKRYRVGRVSRELT